MPRIALATAGATLALAGGVAGVEAQGGGQEVSVRLQPNLAGKPSTLVIEATGDSAQAGGGIPRSAQILVQRGFKVDPKSRAARCSEAQAEASACPEASRIGAGEVDGTASGAIVPGGSLDFTAEIGLFLAPRERSQDLAGIVVAVREPTSGIQGSATGRIIPRRQGPFGYELRFDDLDSAAEPPAGVTIELKRLELRAEAHRRVGGKTRHLIRNPKSCDGSWRSRAVLRFTEGSPVSAALEAPCRARR